MLALLYLWLGSIHVCCCISQRILCVYIYIYICLYLCVCAYIYMYYFTMLTMLKMATLNRTKFTPNFSSFGDVTDYEKDMKHSHTDYIRNESGN